MIYLKTEEQIEKIREADLVVARTLGELAKWVAPGITTRKLDSIAHDSSAIMDALLVFSVFTASPLRFASLSTRQ